MVETSRDWSEKLPFALWAYRTSFRTSTGATPYSLVYGMEVFCQLSRYGGLIGDPRGKFKPSWSGPYVIRELTPKGAAWLTDLDGNQFSEPTNVDQLKKCLIDFDGFFIVHQISILRHIPLSMMRLYNGQLSFRLSISLELSTIDYIRTSLYGFPDVHGIDFFSSLSPCALDYPDERFCAL
ncbi:hypothetical protein AAG906_002171 [Vitis piasezkii]